MNLIKLSLAAVLFSILSGCSYIYGEDGLIRSEKYDYVVAKQEKELELPAPLTQKGKEDYTVVPRIGKEGNNKVYGKRLAQAAPIQLLAVLENTRVDRKSSVPAVLIVDELEFVWQTVTKFIENHNISTSVLDSDNKMLISQWMAIEDGGVWLGLDGSEEQELIRAQYQISIQKGEIKGEYRLTVERIKSQAREDEDEPWKNIPVTWQESADMMNLLLSYYDTRIRIQDARHQQKIMAGFKVELGQNSEALPALLTSAEESLVWEKIPKVMTELGLKVIDKDLRQKTYFMEYEAVEEGFFASLFDEERPVLQLEPGAYQISLSKNGDQQALTLRDGQGVALEADVLVKLFPELSRLFGDRR